MAEPVTTLIHDLAGLTVPELRRRYLEVFGEPTRCGHKRHLVRRLAWRLRALAEGDLSQRARRRAAELANDADLRLHPPSPPTPLSPRRAGAMAAVTRGPVGSAAAAAVPDARLPMPGTLLRRRYKGRTVVVQILAKGFEYGGARYSSLSAVARAVTGSHWNGFLFFGLVPPGPGANGEAKP
jgi:hypothetical protein